MTPAADPTVGGQNPFCTTEETQVSDDSPTVNSHGSIRGANGFRNNPLYFHKRCSSKGSAWVSLTIPCRQTATKESRLVFVPQEGVTSRMQRNLPGTLGFLQSRVLHGKCHLRYLEQDKAPNHHPPTVVLEFSDLIQGCHLILSHPGTNTRL